MRLWSLVLLFTFVCTGCTKVPEISDAGVSEKISPRLDKDIHWNHQEDSSHLVKKSVQYLLSSPLSVDAAVQVALLNNQEIQATFEDLGIAHADLIEAGLFHNPVFEGFVRVPSHTSSPLNLGFSVVGSFLDLFLIPLRQKVAKEALFQTELDVSQKILALAYEVQENYFTLLATQKQIDLLKDIVTACEAAKTLSTAQLEQGNISTLEVYVHEKNLVEARLSLTKAQEEEVKQKKHFSILLGISQEKVCLADSLPLIKEKELLPDALEAIAMKNRLDLEYARVELQKVSSLIQTTAWWTHIKGEAGVSLEKDPEGSFVIGPTLSGALPLFNYGQADYARLHSLYQQKLCVLKSLEIQVAAEVRAAQEELRIKRTIVQTYQETLLPLQQKRLSMSQRFYNGMALSVYTLLDAKKQELCVEIERISALKDYWIARIALEKALGGHLDSLEKK